MKRVLVNLLGNAAKFKDKGVIELKTEVMQQKSDDYQLRFGVLDTGIGIKVDKKDKIFKPFA
jgi:signal transduction histidine kinase